MSRALLTIGSNTFAKTNIDKAKRMLTFLFPNIIFSDPILSEPDDDRYSYLFRNILAVVDTDMPPEEIINKIKQTERAVGRTPRDKYVGKMVIDIDLVKYGDAILRPKDYEREYVQHLLGTMDLPEEEVTIPQPDTDEIDAQAGVSAEIDTDMLDVQDVQADQEASDLPDPDEVEPAETEA
ncbi:MAG TPA: 2-amino-4-hydroxy-6-hydroxymethyldihydropteridine diphosphokinase [Bacteroidales bacterium]|jgi:2-amino-4-hydroxy-6-hydroxymethyldihydropteridine diphosphokinase|nr:2-amino-4-hydroxy-6-hydroxymethyldihydropteridine diphosphokinase [Bacteroidales bacterium]